MVDGLTTDSIYPKLSVVRLTLQLRLLPTAKQSAQLRATMRAFNAAASYAARAGFAAGVFSQPSIHKLCYYDLREKFGLSSQTAVRAIGKAVECFSRDKAVCPVFWPDGAMTYDSRLMSFKGVDTVSTLNACVVRHLPLPSALPTWTFRFQLLDDKPCVFFLSQVIADTKRVDSSASLMAAASQ